MSISQLRFRRKIGNALYGEVMECELRQPNDHQSHVPPLPPGQRCIVAVKSVALPRALDYQYRFGVDRIVDDPRQECRVAELLALNGGHPNIVASYFQFEEHGRLYLVSEYCADGDLYAHITATAQGGSVDECTSIHIMNQVFAGVSFLNNQLGIAHRDLSLENVLMHNGECKISDFGLSVSTNTLCRGCVGKDYYMAPEVVEGEEYDPVAADIWSLGIMWFVMLTGSPLVSLASRQNKAFVALEQCGVGDVFTSWKYDSKLSGGVIDLISQMLEIDPAKRISLNEILKHAALN
ncbi:hypothetical protein ON010_g10659 [Phytophthora cinnamomi]|nr:hypothetical protein ON010_g10659 [Phytophthora cinnamomi]